MSCASIRLPRSASSTNYTHQAAIQRPRDLDHDYNRTLSSFWTSQAALGSFAPLFGKPHPRLFICSSTCYFSTHQPSNLSILLLLLPPLQHDSLRRQAPTHACCRSHLYDMLHPHLNQASGPQDVWSSLTRKAMGSCNGPLSSMLRNA